MGGSRYWEGATKLDRVVDEAANRRRVVPIDRIYGTMARTRSSPSVPAGIWHFDEFASSEPRLSSSPSRVHARTRAQGAGSRMHRIRVKGAGYFLRGTFGILERKTS